MNMALEKELETYERLKYRLLCEHRGEWVVIHGEEWDVWHCYEDALKSGYKLYGLKPFLVRRIVDRETAVFLAGANQVKKFHPEEKTRTCPS